MTVVAEALGVEAEPSLLGTVPPPASPSALRWSRFVPATAAEGPGLRAAVWVQGCSVCAGMGCLQLPPWFTACFSP